MPDIAIEASRFPVQFGHFNATTRLSITYRDYLRASLTVGFQSGRDARAGNRRVRKGRLLSGLQILNYLVDSPQGLCLAPEFDQLDMSEKNPLTYWHGTILAKIVADRYLGIPWLANVDAMREQDRVTTSATTKERGDFVGLDRQLAWHALEAKGRTHRVFQNTIDRAKLQASRIISIDDHRPQTCVACVSDLSTAPITVHLQDPPIGGDKPRRLNLTDFMGYYYGNISAFLERSPDKRQVDELGDYRFARLNPSLTFGLYSGQPTELYVGLPQSLMRRPSNAPEMTLAGQIPRSPYVGSDLIALAGRLPEWPARLVQSA